MLLAFDGLLLVPTLFHRIFRTGPTFSPDRSTNSSPRFHGSADALSALVETPATTRRVSGIAHSRIMFDSASSAIS